MRDLCPPLLAGLLVAGACGLPGADADSASEDFTKTPVLFVHGSGLDSATWKPLIEYLARLGYPRPYLHAVDLLPNDGENIRAAEGFIKPAVDRLLQRTGETARSEGLVGIPGKVDIVSHSMGAASSRWYAAKIAPERVRIWISIAGANHGTDALRDFPSPGNDEMVPAFASSVEESFIQVALNGTRGEPRDETPFGVGPDPPGRPVIAPDSERGILYLTVFIEPDGWIRPSASALLAGAGGPEIKLPPGIRVEETTSGNFRFTGRSDHDGLPSHPEVMRLISVFLALRDAGR